MPMNSVSKKPIIGGIILAAIIGLVAAGAQINPEYTKENSGSEIWNTRISGPEYHDISKHQFGGILLEKGVPYKFEFVPMGDSPEQLQIKLGNNLGSASKKIVYSEKFILEKELVDTGISKYYTWDYLGDRYLDIFDSNCELGDPYHGSSVCEDTYTLEFERFGNLEGSVSISLSKVDTSI